MNSKLKGYGIIFMSTVFLYIMSIVAKVLINKGHLPITEIVFARFIIGLMVATAIVYPNRNKKEFQVVKRSALIMRAIGGTCAITLFFIVVQYSTTKANIYNQTQPVYIALLAPLLLKDEKYSVKRMFAVVVALAGIILISGLAMGKFGFMDFVGVIMGIATGLGTISLREARKTENSNVILLYLMGLGTIVTIILFGYKFKVPTMSEFWLLLLVGVLSYLGQYSLSVGYRYTSSLEGSLISSTRIFIAAIFGALLFGEPFTISIVVGGTLIFCSIILLGLSGKKREKKKLKDLKRI